MLSTPQRTPSAHRVIDAREYDKLIAKESQHWGEVQPDLRNPQIWHDPLLFRIFFGREYSHLVESTVAHGPRVLELGCGEGALTLELASRGMRVTAIDLSPVRIDRARRKAAAGSLTSQPTFVTADLNTVTLDSDAYDCVVAHDSLHHILALGRLCDEVKKSLRPGGHLLVMDYIGMGILRKVLAGMLYAILPTYQPYLAKWALRRRMTSFLASENRKRAALTRASSRSLHIDSPFEEISQASIIDEISNRFEIVEQQTFCPFWFYLVAKVRVPKPLRYRAARFLRAFDDLITRLHFAKGAYIWMAAQKPNTTIG